MRLGRQNYFMEITKLVAARSTCLSRRVGALLVRDSRIVATGYNGPPSGHPHCETCKRNPKGDNSGKDLDKCPAIHAEVNVLIEGLKSCGKEGLTNTELYCTVRPCINCIKLISTTKIKRIYYIKHYLSSDCRDALIREANIKEIQYQDTQAALDLEELAIAKTIKAARTVQEFLWSDMNHGMGLEEMRRVFAKRLDKISQISLQNPHWRIELKKRLLQMAAISVMAIGKIDKNHEITEGIHETLPSNLPQYKE